MKLKFFNILDVQTFSRVTEIEQKTILIKTNVYNKGKSDNVFLNINEAEIWRGSNDYPKYLGNDFEFDGINYKLNDEFLSEVLNECICYIKINRYPLIEDAIETLQLKSEFSEVNFVEGQLQNETKNYTNFLSQKLFQKLHNSDFENEQEHINILKNYLRINWYDLSEYLFGLNNIQSFHIVSTYYNYLRIKKILNFLYSKKDIEKLVVSNNIKFSRPMFIAMLNELGFFKFEYIKNLSNDQKAKVILALLQQDYNNKNSIHNIVKNFQGLNPNSQLNPKYTANTHIDAVKKILNDISNNL